MHALSLDSLFVRAHEISVGKILPVKKKRDPNPQVVLTLQFKIKSLKASLRKTLELGAYETNQVWNYCNAVSHKAIVDRGIWLTHFDLTKLMTGDLKYSETNPDGFKVINSALAGRVAKEYTTRRNQFNKNILRYKKSFGSNKNNAWIPFAEEHVNISYLYDYVERSTTEKINKKTGATVLNTKEKLVQKRIRVAGKNTPQDNMYALYSLENNSGNPYGLPENLSAPVIKVLGTHIKVFNEELLSYYLYHLGAHVRGGSITENNIGEWFLNVAVSVDEATYQDKHLFGKRNINETAKEEELGLDFGVKTMCAASDGVEYSSGNHYQDYEETIRQAQRSGDKKKTKRLHLKVKNKRLDTICKASLDIARKAQWIKAGDLKITVLIKGKTLKISPKDLKKQRSQRKKKAGIEKRLQNTKINKENGTLVKKQTKKRKGLGKSLSDQGIGILKLRLGNICHRTGRSFELVNEKYTTQVCTNCDSFTGPRGLTQLGVREWTCSRCEFKHKRDVCGARNMLRTKHIARLVRARSLSGQASADHSHQTVEKNGQQHRASSTSARDGSSLGG